MKKGFLRFHPAVNFAFYICAAVLAVCFAHPVFIAASLIGALVLFFLIEGKSGVKLFASLLALSLAVAAINPIFSQNGETILFKFFGRRYTLEALIYGGCVGMTVLSVTTLFAGYNEIMTSDRFTSLFGGVIPSLSLLIAMVLRLVPLFKRKAQVINTARAGVGKGAQSGAREKIKNAVSELSKLTSWALEDGIICADSMRQRGFGTGKRTSFSGGGIKKTDIFALIFMFIFAVLTVVFSAFGAKTLFYPHILIDFNIYTAVGAGAYLMFMLFPTAVIIKEEALWRISLSKI